MFAGSALDPSPASDPQVTLENHSSFSANPEDMNCNAV